MTASDRRWIPPETGLWSNKLIIDCPPGIPRPDEVLNRYIVPSLQNYGAEWKENVKRRWFGAWEWSIRTPFSRSGARSVQGFIYLTPSLVDARVAFGAGGEGELSLRAS